MSMSIVAIALLAMVAGAKSQLGGNYFDPSFAFINDVNGLGYGGNPAALGIDIGLQAAGLGQQAYENGYLGYGGQGGHGGQGVYGGQAGYGGYGFNAGLGNDGGFGGYGGGYGGDYPVQGARRVVYPVVVRRRPVIGIGGSLGGAITLPGLVLGGGIRAGATNLGAGIQAGIGISAPGLFKKGY